MLRVNEVATFLDQEFQRHDRGEENPTLLIDGTLPGPDNAKYCGLARVFVNNMETKRTCL